MISAEARADAVASFFIDKSHSLHGVQYMNKSEKKENLEQKWFVDLNVPLERKGFLPYPKNEHFRRSIEASTEESGK